MAAVFEWIIALVFTFYVLTFLVDFLPAVRATQAHSNQEMMHMKEAENGNAMKSDTGYPDGHANGVNGNTGYPDLCANGVNGNAYTIGAAGHEGVGTGRYRPPAAQNF